MFYKYTRLYNNPQWRRLRAEVLAADPLCWYCQEANKIIAADTVDHIVPHKGDETLFWERSNLRSCCTSCHNHLASIKDRDGIVPGCDVDGEPLDSKHPWYQERN